MKALITGITGQDGSYLAELLLSKGYEVFGIIRRSSSFNTQRIEHIFNKITLVYGDITDSSAVNKIINDIIPDEIYNLAAQSHVKVSFDIPEYTVDVTGVGTLRILEVIKNIKQTTGKNIKFYQASSSEMFGMVQEIPQKETTPFYPRSPYGCAKVYSYWITKNYRESYGLFACNGILFNHESPRRGETFVTHKITKAAVRIASNIQDVLYLGNIDTKRDWGYAKDYVKAMWLMMQQDNPDDYIISSFETHSVREFLLKAFEYVGIKLESNNISGENECFTNAENGKIVVRIDKKYFRPAEVDLLIGDNSKAKKLLNWQPEISFDELIKEMIDEDSKQLNMVLYGVKNVK
jgi:GDPmannose 4,6-dehydratase